MFRSGYTAAHGLVNSLHYGGRTGTSRTHRDDHITLTGLTVRGHHGVFEHEKRDGQDFVIDATVRMNLADAAAGDDLAKTLNYAELAELARSVVAGPPRDLIETVATEIADTAVARWPIDAIEVTVHKPHAPIPLEFADVAVTVRRDGQQHVGQSLGGHSPGVAVIAGQPPRGRHGRGPLADGGAPA
ncbi:MAG: dihydroneopterin aldolase [Nakamurella sp.]